MRKLIVEEWISLDGYTTDKNGSLDFFAHLVRNRYADAFHENFLHDIDCILMGRKTYQQFVTVWPGRSVENDLLAMKMNTCQKIVFSSSLAKAPWGDWKGAIVEAGDPIVHIKNLKSLAGKNLVLWGSISLAALLMKEKMIDEYRLFICPLITGGGKKFFHEGAISTALSLIESKCYDHGVVYLNYKIN
jgi:dihydrofolate reductase